MKESSPSIRRKKCSICGKEFTFGKPSEHKGFPFCSPRCKEVDLGNWLSERYIVSRPGMVFDPDEEPEADPNEIPFDQDAT